MSFPIKSFTKAYKLVFVTAEFHFNYSHTDLCFDDIVVFLNLLANDFHNL